MWSIDTIHLHLDSMIIKKKGGLLREWQVLTIASWWMKKSGFILPKEWFVIEILYVKRVNRSAGRRESFKARK